MSGHGCPVLEELEMREDYGDEMNPPVLSGGDYDISAIRDCAENCKAASLAWSRGEHLRSIALILGLAPGDTAEIDGTVRELIRSRDAWRAQSVSQAEMIRGLNSRMLEPVSDRPDPAAADFCGKWCRYSTDLPQYVRGLETSLDEWRDRAAANAARIEELTRGAAGTHMALIRIVNGDATVDGMKAIANAALDQS